MDYEIELGTLESKKTDLETLKTDSENIFNEVNSSLSKYSGTEISGLCSKLKSSAERLKKGGTNSNKWYTDYVKDLTALEDNLAAFTGTGLTEPTEFKGEFIDLFGKITMPVLKSDAKTTSIEGMTKPTTNNLTIEQALEKYGIEYEGADKKYLSDNTFMTVTKLENGAYVTHVVVADPSQIHKGYANGSYGNGLENISSAKDRYNWVVGVNGSHFSGSGSQDINRQNVQTNLIAINDGKLTSNSASRAGGLEICLTKDGKFFTAPKGASAQDLLNQGVVQTYSSHETNILENGKVQTTYPSAMSREYNRTVIGMVKPGEYYIYSGRSSATTAAKTLQEKGCIWAKSLDQGGSVSLATKDESLIQSAKGESGNVNGERKVGDFLYFADV